MKSYFRSAFLGLFIMSASLILYAAEPEKKADTDQEASSALEQATRVLETALSGTIVPEVQATKKGLDELKKDMEIAIKEGRGDIAAIQKLQPKKAIAEA